METSINLDSDHPESSDPTFTHQCGLCSKTYKRLEHLQRHLFTHDSARPYSCHLCNASFQRSDVLRRHVRSCNGTRFKPRVPTKKACDSCSRTKRACDCAQPCGNCQRKSIPCTYSSHIRPASISLIGPDPIPTPTYNAGIAGPNDAACFLHDDNMFSYTSIDFSDWTHFVADDIMFDELIWPGPESSMPDGDSSLKFLESFTRNKGFVLSFDCGSAAERQLALRVFQGTGDQLRRPIKSDEASFINLDDSINAKMDDHIDPLMTKAAEIVRLIEEVVKVKPRNSTVCLAWSPDAQKLCEDFFSPTRLRLYLELYWTLWHPNVNFMHRPTFDPTQAKGALVAAMAIIGASVSPGTSDNDEAKSWFNCVEEVVFRDEDFSRDDDGDSSPRDFPSERRLQAIQAAYMVCLFQNWEGSNQSKRRIRRFRYSTLVAVVRDTGIRHARHQPTGWTSFEQFSWSEFVLREQLIRTYLWVFLLDTAFVIFNNAPPRMAIKEMKVNFASNEGIFQAATGESCWQQLTANSAQHESSFSFVTEMMCKGMLTSEDHVCLATLGGLNLFALTSAIHSLIFQFQQSFLDSSSLTPIHNALQQWYDIWKIYIASHANTAQHAPLGPAPAFDSHNVRSMWKRVGFSRFCIEYWLLAKMVTGRLASSHSAPADFSVSTGSEPAIKDEILEKYDETSMQQVNQLISEFQKVIL